MSHPDPSSSFQLFLERAFQDYERQTGTKLEDHPLARQFETCDSVDSITRVLQQQARAFQEFRGGDGKVMKSLKSVVHVLHALSTNTALSEGLGLPFPPAKAVFAGFALLLSAAKDVSASYDALIDLLESIENFLSRLNIYTKIPPTPIMTEIIVKILVELLSTLAVATKQMKQGRPKKFVKKLFGQNDVEVVLQKLDRLTLEEARTTAAQNLEAVYCLVQNMRMVMDDGKALAEDVRDALEMMKQQRRDKLQQDVRKWLSPPDPWKNHNTARGSQHSGTATWFTQGNLFSEWKSSGPSSLLWIHGKPGAGKSVLCSSIIQDIRDMRKLASASLAFFYCDFRDVEKKERRGLLSSLLVQLCDQSDFYCAVLSDLYSAHENGSQHPSDDELASCLENVLKLPGQAPVYIIIDGLDECPTTTGLSFPREEVLQLVERLVGLKLLHLRICVTSRPEADIEPVLGPLVFRSVSLHVEGGQIEDISEYVRSFVHTDSRMRRWKATDKASVIDILTERADGMFRWVFCQLAYLSCCLPGRIQRALNELPSTLDGTYERTLKSIGEQNWEFAHRLFQCVAATARPLRVEELAEFLAFDFDTGSTPMFLANWRPEDPAHAVLSTCSSLLAVVDVDGSSVVQFAHFSVKEYLTSKRLANADDAISRFHVSMTPAHTIVAQACLGTLLHLDEDITKDSVEKFPLVGYAAEHWVGHARFENVWPHTEDAAKLLFEPSKHHLSVWVWIYDPEDGKHRFQDDENSGQRWTRATPLHYAAACGIHEVAKFLIVDRSLDVNARGFNIGETPLGVACRFGFIEVVKVLLEYGANMETRTEDDWSPLERVLNMGHVEIAQLLLQRGTDPEARDKHRNTPLHLASHSGQLAVVRVLLEHGVDVNAKDLNNSTPLLDALQRGYVEIAQFLLQRGADPEARDNRRTTPLHLASRSGKLAVVRVLLERGVDVNAKDKNSTPLHGALINGHVEIAQLLLERGADPEVRDNGRTTPLHLASRSGQLGVVRVLLEHGVDVNAKDEKDSTPLHDALRKGHVEIAQLLLERGADPEVRDNDRTTPLHLASRYGQLGVVRVLLEHGVDVNAKDEKNSTPLHDALRQGHVEIAQLLLQRGADPEAREKDMTTPLHLASRSGQLAVVRVLLEHGVDVNARDENNSTPLHDALNNRHVEIAQLLLERGADPEVRGNDRTTPLHLASRYGQLAVVRVLLEHGVDANAKDENNSTPLHDALNNRHVEVAQLLLKRGADPEARDKYRNTPLHLASFSGELAVVRVLLEHGVDVNTKDEDNSTPLHDASSNGHEEIARVLLEHGADTNAQDSCNRTPLYLASEEGYPNTVRLLLQRSSDVHARDGDGQTPFQRASARGHHDVMQLLLMHGAVDDRVAT